MMSPKFLLAILFAAGLATPVSATGCPDAQSTCPGVFGNSTSSTTAIDVTVFSPGLGDVVGVAGAGFVVDLALDVSAPQYNDTLSPRLGYKPFFNDPSNNSTFHPGPAIAAPGLVVLLSTTKSIPGTVFKGPNTNLAGLFQITGTALVNNGTTREVWSTWLVGKAIAGMGIPSNLTVFVLNGTAPTYLVGSPSEQIGRMSNVVSVPFYLA